MYQQTRPDVWGLHLCSCRPRIQALHCNFAKPFGKLTEQELAGRNQTDLCGDDNLINRLKADLCQRVL